MPWTEENYPESMKGLDEKVRKKAIEIANALVYDGMMEKQRAIPIAISKAKEWVQDNN